MGLDLINQYTAKILLATQDGDSINRISKKTGISYAYTHEWITKLEEENIIHRKNGVHVSDQAVQEAFEDLAQTIITRGIDLDTAYLLPNFAGRDYRFTKTDAVFFWTQGGYQIARNQDDYPIFIDVNEDEVEQWKRHFQSYGIETSVEERIQEGQPGIYYVLFPRQDFQTEWVENASVTPLQETVEWMQEYPANFQPALEMIDEIHDLDLDVTYREREVMGR